MNLNMQCNKYIHHQHCNVGRCKNIKMWFFCLTKSIDRFLTCKFFTSLRFKKRFIIIIYISKKIYRIVWILFRNSNVQHFLFDKSIFTQIKYQTDCHRKREKGFSCKKWHDFIMTVEYSNDFIHLYYGWNFWHIF